MSFLVAEHISHRYPDGKQVLADISLATPERTFMALVGSSGIGKSTLLRILAGLIHPTSGRVLLNGQPPELSTQSIGIVFQKDNLLPWRTVSENIALPLEVSGTAAGRIADRVREMLTLVGLSEAGGLYPAQLSGGMAQRVALARALIHRPDLLLLDEPFGALDALTRERMGQELLRIWQAQPVTVVMVTHSISEAVFLADQIMILNGTASQNGGPATVTRLIDIPIQRPRAFDVQTRPEFLACVSDVRQALG